METVNWLLAIGALFLLVLVFVFSIAIMALIDKRDALMKDKILLSEENKTLVKENERLCNHIFVLQEIDLKAEPKNAPQRIKVQKEQKK